MRVVQRSEQPGHYPIALIPGQFVDHYKVTRKSVIFMKHLTVCAKFIVISADNEPTELL